jgi:hypothetical protein
MEYVAALRDSGGVLKKMGPTILWWDSVHYIPILTEWTEISWTEWGLSIDHMWVCWEFTWPVWLYHLQPLIVMIWWQYQYWVSAVTPTLSQTSAARVSITMIGQRTHFSMFTYLACFNCFTDFAGARHPDHCTVLFWGISTRNMCCPAMVCYCMNWRLFMWVSPNWLQSSNIWHYYNSQYWVLILKNNSVTNMFCNLYISDFTGFSC